MNENEHCRLCRVSHESAAEKTDWKGWKEDCVGLYFELTRLGRLWGTRMVTL